jgi:UMF1 family MFS transporter
MVKFLIAFWLYSDGFGTIIKMAVIYAGEIFAKRRQDPTAHLIGTVLLVQFVGIPCTLFWGRVARRFGAKSAVMACLFVYMLICIFGYFMDAIWHFYVLGLAVAFVQGGSQALSRSLFAVLVPQGKEAEFFGFYNISGKFAGVIGPAMMSIIAVATGTSRPAILALIVFFVLGGALLAAVRFDGQTNSHERRMS